MTIKRRFKNLGNDHLLQLKEKAKKIEMFSIWIDESTDLNDTAQLLAFIRGVSSTFEITEELAGMKSMYGKPTIEYLFREIWSRLAGATTDGARNMFGRYNGLVARFHKKVTVLNNYSPISTIFNDKSGSENPSSAGVSTAPSELQLELIELQCQMELPAESYMRTSLDVEEVEIQPVFTITHDHLHSVLRMSVSNLFKYSKVSFDETESDVTSIRK
ncbi:hypothetical protein RF11_01505 [Thelohanellus kitauei]|uniref:General transcription factor II-I repeat domain-containing protein 2 n=1 Tax=Thelohanellus kitauei TaxID=669202 RepID=A0A0C2IZD1_THEKT|nr:hypothetical protein RF11_01505 [Thelohanellus kitauei]